MQGRLVSEQPWYDLAQQSVQPLAQIQIQSRLCFGAEGARLAVLQASSCQEASWHGGSCLALQGGDPSCPVLTGLVRSM